MGSDNPPNPETGGKGFGERAQIDDTSVVDRTNGCGGRLIEPEQTVGVVFNNQDSVVVSDVKNLEPALPRERYTSGVLEVRNQIEKLDCLTGSTKRGDPLLQGVRNHAIVIHRDMFHGGLVGTKNAHRAHIAGRFSQDNITRVNEQFADQIEGLL